MASLISLALSIFPIVCMWFIFEKAGEARWKAIIPIYNGYILAKIANRKWTFWVQFIGGALVGILLVVSLFGVFTMIALNDSSDVTNYVYDEDFEDDYYKYEDDYMYSETDDNYNSQSDMSNVYINGEQLTEEELAELEDDIDEMISEMGPAIGILIFAALIPFLFILPMVIVNFCQYVGLAKAFGMHWAFAFVLLLVKPVGFGVLAFASDAQYVGDAGTAMPNVNAAAYAGGTYSSMDPALTNINNDEPISKERITPDVSEPPQAKDFISMKHRCPNCGYESEKEPLLDKFCPNCGHSYHS